MVHYAGHVDKSGYTYNRSKLTSNFKYPNMEKPVRAVINPKMLCRDFELVAFLSGASPKGGQAEGIHEW